MNSSQVLRRDRPIAIPANSTEREFATKALLHLLRPSTEPHSAFDVDRISGEQWEHILQQAEEHKIHGLLYRRLKRAPPSSYIPVEVIQSLRRRYLLSTTRSTRVYHTLGKILRALSEGGIIVVLLKGAFLAEAVYGDTALRPMDDIDLLVRPEDLAQAGQILLRSGLHAHVKANLEHGEKTSHHLYSLPDAHIFVETHWNIDESPSPFKIDVEGLWSRAEQVIIAGVAARGLCPEDLILHVAVHSCFRHLFAQHGLRSMCDLSEIISHYEGRLDWAHVVQRSHQWGTDTCLFLALDLARRLVGARVPDSILAQLKPTHLDARLLAACERRLLLDEDLKTRVSENWGRLRASQTSSAKIATLIQTVFPSPEALARLYSLPSGSRRVFLYYPARLVHLLQRQAHVVWRFLRGDRDTRVWVEGETSRVELETMKKVMLRDRKNTG